MTVGAVALPRVLAFGSMGGDPWGVAWLASPEDPVIVLGGQAGTETATVTLEGQAADDEWHLAGPGIDLRSAPVSHPAEQPAGGFDQLCRMEDPERGISCLGWRAAGDDPAATGRAGSFRQVAAWFEPADGLAVLAVRPGSAGGQENDEMTAAVLDPELAVSVEDPRLSTTYTGQGRPVRAGLELWIGGDEEPYPRRAAGEAAGHGAQWSSGGLALEAQLFRWHSAGRDGAGVYLMGTFQ